MAQSYERRTIPEAAVSGTYLVMGPIDNNVYLLDDGEGGVIVVDPSCDAPAILEACAGRPVSAIFVTHEHWDHVGALADLKELTGAPIYASRIDGERVADQESGSHANGSRACAIDAYVEDGDRIAVGATSWRVIFTPGHTRGGICLLAEDPEGTRAPVLLSGDTLFAGTVGRTDFEGGDYPTLQRSLRRLAELADDTLVLPGHESLTTIGRERTGAFAMHLG